MSPFNPFRWALWLPLMLQAAVVSAAGPLFVVGGGTIDAPLRNHFIELAGGMDTPLLIIPWASTRETAGEANARPFRETGMTRVTVIPETAPDALEAIRKAGALWFGGGQQSTLMDRLETAGLVDAIRMAHQKGTPMGGTSAGAAVMSEVMLAGDTLPPDQGLALWPEVIVDQHFTERRRLARLVPFVLQHPGKLGIGIDESTAALVTDDQFEVVGRGNITVVDTSQVRQVDGNPTGIRLDILQPGSLRPRPK